MSLTNNKYFQISNQIQEKFGLATNVVSMEHLNFLVNYQEHHHLKLAPKLTRADLQPTHFDKMRVSLATRVLSHDVASALRFLAEETNKPELRTTAWFIDTIARWFDLMYSRNPIMALSKIKPEEYLKSISFLKDVMELFENIVCGEKGTWKPIQSGIRLSIKSILDIQDYLLNEKGFKFLLTSRFSQDSLENLFSVIRSKPVIPNALKFFFSNLKTI